MKMLMFVLAAVLFLGLSTEAVAYEFIAEVWRAEYLSACSTLQTASNDCTLCHPGADTSQLNPYSEDLQFYKYDQDVLWAIAVIAIDGDDSDGDGVDNGTEIDVDCTFPGDASSVPTWEQDWSQIKALFR